MTLRRFPPFAAAFCLLALLGLAPARQALAHGDLHDQIVAVSKELETAPDNPALLYKRAELERWHENWAAAAADYDRLAAIDPTFTGVHLGRARMLLAQNQPGPARAELDRFLEKNPAHVDALVQRGRASMALGEPRAAAADFARVLELVPRGEPEYFLEHAGALSAAGDVAAALATLEDGLRRLGPLPTLGLQALELEARLGRFDAALERLDRMSAGSRRVETWLERRGDLLTRAGRPEQAAAEFRAALKALDALPDHLRSTKAMEDLASRLRRKLAHD